MVMEILISVIILFVGIAFLITIHVCVVGRAFREEGGGGRGEAPPRFEGIPSMKAAEIEKLPCFDYNSSRVEVKMSVECAVCLEVFREGEKCRVLPKCSHSFHALCIDSWLLKTAACPICRAAADHNNYHPSQSGEISSQGDDVMESV